MTDTGRRKFLKTVGVSLAINAFLPFVDTFNLNAQINEDSPSLGEIAVKKGFNYGAATTSKCLQNDREFAKIFAHQCKIVSPENEVKWNILRPTSSTYDFKGFDWLINFALSNNQLFRGHTLVWHDALPQWFDHAVNTQNAEKLLLDHINTVVKRHAGKIHSWDVVNEPIAIWDKHPDGLRSSSPWYKFLGAGYIDTAFRASATADPNAMLVLNQNHVEQESDDATRNAVIKLLTKMLSTGTPVHALGIEAHLGGKDYIFNKDKFKNFLRDVANLGLKIIITEIDVTDKYLVADPFSRDQIIATIYENFLSVALDEKAVIGVVSWGLSDKYTWISKYYPRKDGVPVRPLPLDCHFKKKPAWHAIARAFEQAPLR